jgi:hypothetical protein
MLYRGFRIVIESKESSSTGFAVYETFRAHWRRITSADTEAAAEEFVDTLLKSRERLFGTGLSKHN